MKKNVVKLGQTYAAKVSGEVVPVRLDKESPHGGWDGTNMRTKKQVRIKSAGRLRGLWPKKTLAMGEAKADEQSEPKAGEVAKAVMAKRKAAKAAGETPAAKAKAAPKDKKPRNSLLNLAAQVLAEAGEPMNCQQIVEKVLATGLWQTHGLTPQATLHSAVIREIAAKGDAARFRKVERGKFAFAK